MVGAVWFLFWSSCWFESRLFAGEHLFESEKDFALRSIGQLKISNSQGDITVQGWALDKIRLKIKKRVIAESPEEVKRLSEGVDFQFRHSDGNIDISTQFGKELSLDERMKEKESPKVKLEMIIYAPSNLDLKIWTVQNNVVLKNWNSLAEIRSNSGSVYIEGLKAKQLTVVCGSCNAQFRNVRASLSYSGGEGGLELSNVDGKKIYAETTSGPMKLNHVQGDQLYLSKSGQIEGQFLEGKVEFHVKNSNIQFRELSGFLSGTLESGGLVAGIRSWEFLDKGLIESIRGNIQLTFPRRISADVDIWSVQGNVNVDFPVVKVSDPLKVGPEPINRIVGHIRDGGNLLKVYSETGDIVIRKGD